MAVLPTPPTAALKAALDRIGATGLYRSLSAERNPIDGTGVGPCDAYVTADGDTTHALFGGLSAWAVELFAAFAPLHLIRVRATFQGPVGRTGLSPRAAAVHMQAPVHNLARRMRQEWPKIGRGRDPRFEVALFRPMMTEPLACRLWAGSDAGTFELSAGSAKAFDLDEFDPWLSGVNAFVFTFRWTRPSAHCLAEAAAVEARS